MSIFLCAIILFCGFVMCGDGLKETLLNVDATSYSAGDIIEFGNYPQTEVTNETLINKLNKCSASWSYALYKNFSMRYKDVEYNGNKYRAIVSNSDNKNGYVKGTVYWFKYEPIKWIVLDPSKKLVVSSIILDAQAYNYKVTESEPYSNEDGYRANDWTHSTFRKWLNNDFYYTAFSASNKSNIVKNVQVNVSYPDSSVYIDSKTSDYVFVLSSSEINGSYYSSFTRVGTDYAYSQGCNSHQSNHDYWVRNANSHSSLGVAIMGYNNKIWSVEYNTNGFAPANMAGSGVVPAIYLKELVNDSSIDYSENCKTTAKQTTKATTIQDTKTTKIQATKTSQSYTAKTNYSQATKTTNKNNSKTESSSTSKNTDTTKELTTEPVGNTSQKSSAVSTEKSKINEGDSSISYSTVVENEFSIDYDENINIDDVKFCKIDVLADGDGSATDSLTVLSGKTITITATPDENSSFIGWYEDDKLISTETTFSFVVKSDRTVVARFENISNRSIIKKFTENINKGVIIFLSILIILLILSVAILL